MPRLRLASAYWLALFAFAHAPVWADQSGETVYTKVCAACHATGINGAPAVTDQKKWKKLIAEGLADIGTEAVRGVRGMPARGGDLTLTDTEVARAVVFMARKNGATWKEPVVWSVAKNGIRPKP
jgi:cytochrome c5